MCLTALQLQHINHDIDIGARLVRKRETDKKEKQERKETGRSISFLTLYY